MKIGFIIAGWVACVFVYSILCPIQLGLVRNWLGNQAKMCNILDQRKSTKLYKEMGHLVGILYKTFTVRINRSDVMKQATEEGMLAN